MKAKGNNFNKFFILFYSYFQARLEKEYHYNQMGMLIRKKEDLVRKYRNLCHK